MKKKWIKDLTENEVIHTPEKWMAQKVVWGRIDMGQDWAADCWRVFGSDTCYMPFQESYSNIDYCKSKKYTIYSFYDILDFREETKSIYKLIKEHAEMSVLLGQSNEMIKKSAEYGVLQSYKDFSAKVSELLNRVNEK